MRVGPLTLGIGLVVVAALLAVYQIGAQTRLTLAEIPAPPALVRTERQERQELPAELAGATVLARDQHGNVWVESPGGQRFFVNNQGKYFQVED